MRCCRRWGRGQTTGRDLAAAKEKLHGDWESSNPARPLLMIDIDGVLSLFGKTAPGALAQASTTPGAGGAIPLDRRHTALPFGHGRRSPARARPAVRSRLGERLGGEGRGIPPAPARPARRTALPALRDGRSPAAHGQRALEARCDRGTRGRAPARMDRRLLQRRLRGLGRRAQRADAASSDGARARPHIAGGAAAGGVGDGAGELSETV